MPGIEPLKPVQVAKPYTGDTTLSGVAPQGRPTRDYRVINAIRANQPFTPFISPSLAAESAVLEMQKFSLWYANNRALYDIDMGISKGRVTALIVTHNMPQAARVSSYTAFMYLGRLVEYGPTREVFQNPHLPETEDYVTGRFG